VKAAIYGRYSTDKQRDASIDDQFRECERVARSAGLEVVARFEDKSISGGTTSRPGYQALLTAARARKFEVIVCEDISRLWRNRAEFGPRSAELEDLGVHCLTCVGDDTRRDGWGLVIQIKQAVAEHARRESSYRTRRGLEGNAIAGKPTGGRAFGYIAARDSAVGRIEIDEAQAAIVRRIFDMYASGVSPRTIAATLNAEGVPSPGASWNRTVRRRDRKWLASAIHGDVNRGTGILNNRRYVGVTLWGRSEWKRSAADSKNRKHKLLAVGSAHETVEERLRIVSDELWQKVKARQKGIHAGVGKLVRGGFRQRAPGAGRPAKYLFSGLLACGVCDASFVIRNRTCYACASWWNGAACTNSINVPRETVEEVMLGGIREDLTDPAEIAEIEVRVRAALRRREKAEVIDHRPRMAQLQAEIDNLIQAIASGGLRGSQAIGQRLQSAEAELERLKAAQKPVARPAVLVPPGDVRRRLVAMQKHLDQVLMKDPERGRAELRGILGGKIRLNPDEQGGRFLWAHYSLGILPLLSSNLANADLMVAGAGFANFRKVRALR
jgi:DNA invertase Pin-like site-specific DNA recombinase